MGKGLLAWWRRRMVARGLAGAVLFAVPVAVAALIGFGTSLSGVAGGLTAVTNGPDAVPASAQSGPSKLNRAVVALADRQSAGSAGPTSAGGTGGGSDDGSTGTSTGSGTGTGTSTGSGSSGSGSGTSGNGPVVQTPTISTPSAPTVPLPGGGSTSDATDAVNGTVNNVLGGVNDTVNGLLGR